MPEPTLLTIILNYKTAEMTLQAAEAALAAMEGIAGEIVIVDNDSQDGSFETMTADVGDARLGQGHRVRVIQSGRNGGFGAGNNFGIRAGLSDGIEPDFVYILNSDAFPKPDAIRALLRSPACALPTPGSPAAISTARMACAHATTFRFPSIASEFEGAIRFGPVSRLLEIPPGADGTCRRDPARRLAGRCQPDDAPARCSTKSGSLTRPSFSISRKPTSAAAPRGQAHRIDFVPESEVTHIGSVSTGMKAAGSACRTTGSTRGWYYFAKNHGALYAALATLVASDRRDVCTGCAAL